MTVIRQLDAIVQQAMRGSVVAMPANGPSIAAQCAFRLCRLGEEEADARGVLDLIQSDAGLCRADILTDSVVSVLGTPVADIALVAVEGALNTLSVERQSSLFALAIVVWSISEAKCGAVNDVTDYTPGLERVLDSIQWLFHKDSWGADNRQSIEAIAEALRANVATWQIKGHRNIEWAGE